MFDDDGGGGGTLTEKEGKPFLFSSSVAQKPKSVLGHLIVEVSRSHTTRQLDTHTHINTHTHTHSRTPLNE